jgi:hypothetical protein
MDKHQRKQLARWETKKAKDAQKFEEKMRQQFDDDARDTIEKFAKTYTPDPTKVLDGMTKEGIKLLAELDEVRFYPRSTRYFLAEMLLFGERAVGWNPIMSSHGYWSEYRRLYQYKDNVLQERIDVPKSIQAVREYKDTNVRMEHLRKFMSSLRRLNDIRDELAVATHKFRTIQNCRIIKEELMMNVWHPRRVEHILETYGWEVLDNLLGVE